MTTLSRSRRNLQLRVTWPEVMYEPATVPILDATNTVRISAVPMTSSRCSGASMPDMAAFNSSTAS
jgi:hypothetical protein